MSNKMKRRIMIILSVLLIIGTVSLIYVITSVQTESGVLNFSDENKQEYVLSSDSERSKKITFSLDVKEDNGNAGAIVVKVIDTTGDLILEKEVSPGESLDSENFFSGGGNEVIIIDGTNYNGQVSYSKKTVKFYWENRWSY